MPSAIAKPATTSVRWPVPAALAVPALALGIVISLSSDHSVRYGFIVLTIFALGTAAASAVGAAVLPRGEARATTLTKAGAALLGGVAAFILIFLGTSTDGARDAAVLQWTIAAVLAVLAANDIVLGARTLRSDRFGRDWLTLGVLEALGAIAVLVVPPGYSYQYEVTDTKGLPPVHLTLDAAVIDVGLFGAALAIIGVYLAIATVALIPRAAKEAVA